MPGDVAQVLSAAGKEGPVVLTAALFGFYALALAGIFLAAILKVLSLHASKVQGLTDSLSHSISTMTTAQGMREERMTEALRESTTALIRIEPVLRQAALLRLNGAG